MRNEIPGVSQFLKEDRQWRRDQRIRYAKFMLRTGLGERPPGFWEAVLRANGVVNGRILPSTRRTMGKYHVAG